MTLFQNLPYNIGEESSFTTTGKSEEKVDVFFIECEFVSLNCQMEQEKNTIGDTYQYGKN